MKLKSITLAILASSLLITPMVLAEQSYNLNIVRDGCQDVQSNLNRLHSNDALSRVYLGREYEEIISKLMTPMNSRLVLNNLDATGPIQTAAEFSQELSLFRSRYQSYEQTVSHAIQIDCQRSTETFVGYIERARDQRQEVRQSVDQLQVLSSRYRNQIRVLSNDGNSPEATNSERPGGV